MGKDIDLLSNNVNLNIRTCVYFTIKKHLKAVFKKTIKSSNKTTLQHPFAIIKKNNIFSDTKI